MLECLFYGNSNASTYVAYGGQIYEIDLLEEHSNYV